MTPEFIQSLIGPSFAALLHALVRRVRSPGFSGRSPQVVVTVSVNHGLASADVVVRVSSDLNKSSRDLCS